MPDVAYVLGFTPQDLKPDGSFHKLKIALKDKAGLKVQARDGYYAPKQALDPATQAKEEIENAVFSRGEIRDIPMTVKVQAPVAGSVPEKLVVMAHIDLSSITFEAKGDRDYNSLLATFALFDNDGKYVHGQQNKIDLDYSKEQLAAARTNGLNLKSEFDAKPGHYLARVVMRDNNGHMSASSQTVEIQ